LGRRHQIASKTVRLRIRRIRQKNLCGCGLSALEMVLRYYGATERQVDFLKDHVIRRQVNTLTKRGLNEAVIGVLALERGFKATLYGTRIRPTKRFLELGGRVRRVKTGKRTILSCLRRGIPPIVRIPSVKEAYEQRDWFGHYVVVKGVSRRGDLEVADPWYDDPVREGYWEGWSNSLMAISPRGQGAQATPRIKKGRA